MTFRVLFPPSLGAAKASARAELVQDELSRVLTQDVVVEVAPDYETLKQRTVDSEVDLAWAPPALLRDAAGSARAVLRAIRHGGRTRYRAAFVVRTGTPISGIDHLDGRRAAWVNANSSAGYLLPCEHLRRNGLDPSTLFASECFHGSYRTALLSVLRGDDDVATIYCAEPNRSAVEVALEEQIGGLKERLEPVAYTDETDNDGLVVTRRSPPAFALDLIRMLTSERCPALLLDTCGADAFRTDDG